MKKANAAAGSSRDAFPDTNDALYHFLVESLTEFAVFAVSPAGLIISWNSGAQHTFGYSQAEAVGRHFALIFTPDDIASDAPAAELRTAIAGENSGHDRWHVRKNGTRFWGTNTVQPMFDGSGALLGFTKFVRDITQSHLALEALSDSEQRLRLLIESVDEYAIFSVALDGSILSWNAGAAATFGYTENDIIGKQLSILYDANDNLAKIPELELHEATHDGSYTDERWLVRQNKTRFLASSKLSQLKRGPHGRLRGFVKIVHDITERKRIADDMRRRALNDQLTKLPNRVAFYEHVDRAIESMRQRPAHLFAVLFIDLDNFKAVNDVYGHIIADAVLEATARRLEKCVRSRDIVARLGGDEFAILLNGINGVTDANDAGERIGSEMALPIVVDGYEVYVTASVGISLGSVDYEKPEDILRDADAAMYVAKTHGRAQSVIFDPAMHIQTREKLDLETDLRHALDRNELRVEYQPIVALPSRVLVGFEALVRWAHPQRGLLQPREFIARAERTDAIIAIDRWVFRVACAQLSTWQRRSGASALQMSVNFSSKQFSHVDLIDDLRRTLAVSIISRQSMHVEVTETGIVERSDRTTLLMHQIRASGIELHIDDFGMGYASLEALGNTTFDALKIDRSFIAGMAVPNRSELVHAILSLARDMGLVTIAEGVETIEQLESLESFGCDYGQGFFFSKPLDTVAAGAFLTAAGHLVIAS